MEYSGQTDVLKSHNINWIVDFYFSKGTISFSEGWERVCFETRSEFQSFSTLHGIDVISCAPKLQNCS